MIRKFAYVFPGQGSQYVGMGKDFFENYEVAKNIYSVANNTLNRDIAKLCFESSEVELKQTINTQPCIVATEIAIFETLNSLVPIKPCAFAGHSLGEYSAMYGAGVMNLEDTFRAIQKRAEAMDIKVGGKMVAVLTKELDVVENCLNEAQNLGIVSVANYNSLGQVVITGEDLAVDKAVELLQNNGVKKLIPLAVSGAFHSNLMKPSAKMFESIFDTISLNDAHTPVYTNVDGQKEYNADNFREKMPKQIYSSVYWTKTILNMVEDGITDFVEIGPGQVLKGLIRKTVDNVNVININNLETLNSAVNEIKETLKESV